MKRNTYNDSLSDSRLRSHVADLANDLKRLHARMEFLQERQLRWHHNISSLMEILLQKRQDLMRAHEDLRKRYADSEAEKLERKNGNARICDACGADMWRKSCERYCEVCARLTIEQRKVVRAQRENSEDG